MDRKTSKSLYRYLALLCLGAASAANAVEPRTYQLGDGGAVAPHLRLEFGSDNNPLRSDDGSQEAMYLRVQPSVRYLVQRRNNSLVLGYQGNYFQYFEEYCLGQGLDRPGDCLQGSPTYDKASYQDHILSLNGVLEVSRRLRGTLSLSQVIESQPLGTGQSGNNEGVLNALRTPEFWNRQSARVEVSYGAERARGEVRAGLSLGNREFDTERQDIGDRLDERSIAPDVRVLYRVGTRTQVFAGLGASKVRGGDSPRNISRQSFGVEFDSSAITSGSIEFSNVVDDFLDTVDDSGVVRSRQDLKYVGWEVELTWRPRRYSTVTIGGGREAEGGLFNENLGLTTQINAEWAHQWRERFSTRMALDLEFSEDVAEFSVNRDSEDKPVTFRLEANYNIRRWLDIGGFVVIDSRGGQTVNRDPDNRESILDIESRDYGRTLIGVTLNGTI